MVENPYIDLFTWLFLFLLCSKNYNCSLSVLTSDTSDPTTLAPSAIFRKYTLVSFTMGELSFAIDRSGFSRADEVSWPGAEVSFLKRTEVSNQDRKDRGRSVWGRIFETQNSGAEVSFTIDRTAFCLGPKWVLTRDRSVLTKGAEVYQSRQKICNEGSFEKISIDMPLGLNNDVRQVYHALRFS